MEKFNRSRQRDLLERARNAYPHPVLFSNSRTPEFDMVTIRAELHYLAGHGLIELEATSDPDAEDPCADDTDWCFLCALTHRGIDFLAEDGGLSAVLGVLSIKLHQDTVRELLLHRVADSDANSTVKGKMVEQIKALPASTIEQVAKMALDAGIRKLPDVLQWLHIGIPN